MKRLVPNFAGCLRDGDIYWSCDTVGTNLSLGFHAHVVERRLERIGVDKPEVACRLLYNAVAPKLPRSAWPVEARYSHRVRINGRWLKLVVEQHGHAFVVITALSQDMDCNIYQKLSAQVPEERALAIPEPAPSPAPEPEAEAEAEIPAGRRRRRRRRRSKTAA